MDPGTNRAGDKGGRGGGGGGGGDGRVLHTHSIPVHLCRRPREERAARGSNGKRMGGAGSLC